MKKVNFILLFFCSFLSNIQSQNFKTQLQNKNWYVVGRLYTGQPLQLAGSSKVNFDWSTKFLSNGKLFIEETTKESVFDENGNEIGPGFHYIDTSYTYAFRKDRIKIDYSWRATAKEKAITRIAYYKIQSSGDKTGFEFIPIKKNEYEN
jgi:hypothetical protein